MADQQAKPKAKAAVIGALVADAATMGLHWMYDTVKLYALLEEQGKHAAPEFFEPPSCPFYDYKSGQLSPYGHEALGTLTFFATSQSKDPTSFSKFLYEWYKSYTGRQNHTAKILIENMDSGKVYPHCGADDKQAHCFVKAPILSAAYSGTPQLADATAGAVRVQQDVDYTVAVGVTAAKILEKVILGSSVAAAVEWAASSPDIPPEGQGMAQQAIKQKGQPYADVVKANGPSCALPGAFVNALVSASSGASYTDALRDNMRVGGDNCSRSVYIGALIAAQDGEAAIPTAWREKTSDIDTIVKLTDALVG